MRTLAMLCGSVALAMLVGCGSDDSSGPPADIAGNYTVSVTNGPNGCDFDNWQDGNVSQNIPFSITQNGTSVTGNVEGLVGAFVGLWMGTRTYNGNVSGASVSMTAYGTNNHRQLACTYTISSTLLGTLNVNALQGTIVYTAKTNGHPDCGTKEGCSSTQSFSGTRPPK